MKESAIITARRYTTVISEIVSRGFSVMVQGVHASQSIYDNQCYPAVGSEEHRNYAVTI